MSIPVNFSNPIINEKNKDQIEIYIYIYIYILGLNDEIENK
jgi:hypothetical protein